MHLSVLFCLFLFSGAIAQLQHSEIHDTVIWDDFYAIESYLNNTLSVKMLKMAVISSYKMALDSNKHRKRFELCFSPLLCNIDSFHTNNNIHYKS